MLKSLHTFLADRRSSWVHELEADVHKLRYLFWECTRVCNMSCLHCGSDCSRDEHRTGLPAKTILGVLERIARAYPARDIMLVTTGGEPLVRRDLVAVLTAAGRLGFQLGMVTNGYTLSETMARRLASAGLRSIVVSLDGPKPSHDWLRNRSGSFERVCRAIRALVQARVPVVEAVTCVTPRSLDELDQTYDIVRQLGATHWRVFNIFPAGRAKDNHGVLLDESGIRTLVYRMARLRRRGVRDGLVVNLSEEGYLGWEWEQQVRDAPYFCRAGINIAGIMADGCIAACPNLAPSLAQGSVFEDDFVDVWEHRYARFRDRSWTRTGRCADCDHWRVCRGNSLHLWDEERHEPCWCHYEILHPTDRRARG